MQKVVFHRMSPHGTIHLEGTMKVEKQDMANSSFVQFSIWDFLAPIDFLDFKMRSPNSIFEGCGALIFVIDAQVGFLI